MDDRELLAKYERVHAYFMSDPRFWYEKGRQEADKIFCVLASDLRLEIMRRVSPACGRAEDQNEIALSVDRPLGI